MYVFFEILYHYSVPYFFYHLSCMWKNCTSAENNKSYISTYLISMTFRLQKKIVTCVHDYTFFKPIPWYLIRFFFFDTAKINYHHIFTCIWKPHDLFAIYHIFYPTSFGTDKIFCFVDFHLGVATKNWLYLVIWPKNDAKETWENVGFFSLYMSLCRSEKT